MIQQEVRWKHRLKSFSQVIHQLEEFLDQGELNKFEQQGLIQCFEYNYELSWNSIKDFYEAQGETGIQGSRDAFRMAFQRGLVEEGAIWMEMIQSRVLTSHTYNEATATEIVSKIRNTYYAVFKRLHENLQKLAA